MGDTKIRYISPRREFCRQRARYTSIAWRDYLALRGCVGGNWFMQFATGRPVVGSLQHSGVFPPNRGPAGTATSGNDFRYETARCRARAPRAISTPPQHLWGEALTQVEYGWLFPPEALGSNGDFRDHPDERRNIAFRGGSQQAGPRRARDDFRDSLTNAARYIRSPITTPGCGHIAAVEILSITRTPAAFAKIAHKAAYKPPPLFPHHTRYDVIDLQNPNTREWSGFMPRSQLFGPIAAALHYKCLSRLVASLACWALLVPTVGYFHPLGFFANACDSDGTMDAFAGFFAILGIAPKRWQSDICTPNAAMGDTGDFPRPTNGVAVAISLFPDKVGGATIPA